MNTFDWLERRIDPFAPFAEGEMPPTTVARFTWHYLKPVRRWLAVLFVASVGVGLFETSLYLFIGWFVDLLGRSSPARLFAEHGGKLLAVGALILLSSAGSARAILRGCAATARSTQDRVGQN